MITKVLERKEEDKRQKGRGVARKTTSTGLSLVIDAKLYFENRQKSVQSYKYARFKIYVYKY